jgi:glycosyltransferase involved in cell wall biosynthesis
MSAHPNRLKFVFLANISWNIYNYRLPLIEALRDAGHEVVLLAPQDDYTSRLTEKGFRWAHLRMSQRGLNPLVEPQIIRDIYGFYRKEKPDIVHHFTPKGVIYGSLAARWAGVKRTVNTITGLGYVFSDEATGTLLLRSITTRLYRMALSNTTVLFQNAEDMQRLSAIQGVQGADFQLLAGSGINLTKFSSQPEPPGPPVVMLAARLMMEKGVSYFVEAARILQQYGTPARFVLVGSPAQDAHAAVTEGVIRKWVESGLIEWWGWRDDMERVYPQAHIVCLPTYYGEGVPRTLIEAAASGRPIVATDIAGCRKVVQDGVNGFLVPVRDSPMLAQAIQRLIKDPDLRAQMGARGREIAQRDFTARQHIAEYFSAYGLPAPPPET